MKMNGTLRWGSLVGAVLWIGHAAAVPYDNDELDHLFRRGMPDAAACAVADNQRVDCGVLGITQPACENNGCCWAPNQVDGIPWCFHATKPPVATCPAVPLPPAARTDCPAGAANAHACTDIGCCWNPVEGYPGAPWCYRPPAGAAGAAPGPAAVPKCPVTPPAGPIRVDCGTATSTPATCAADGCCWSPVANGPYCYRPDYAGVGVAMPGGPGVGLGFCPAVLPDPVARADCGAASETTCAARGCCWSPVDGELGAAVPPCFRDTTVKNNNKGGVGAYQKIGFAPAAGLATQLVPGYNQVLLLEREFNGAQNGTHIYVLDTDNYDFERDGFAYKPLTSKTDVFCHAGHVMPDGRALSVGGWTGEALRAVRILDRCDMAGYPGQCNFRENQNAPNGALQRPRWYPSTLGMPDGSVAVIGGATDIVPPGVNEPTIEFLPSKGGTLRNQLLVDSDGANLYPGAHVLWDNAQQAGRVFLFGGTIGALYDLNFNLVRNMPGSPVAPGGQRSYPLAGTTVLLPLSPENDYLPEIAACGGGTAVMGNFQPTNPALNDCIRILPTIEGSIWVQEFMPYARVMPDMVVLPDGKYLIVNGAQQGYSGFGTAINPAYTALIYDPKAPLGQRFTEGDTTDVARLYHSEALLLPDGRVLISGSTPNSNSNDPDVPGPTGAVFPTEYHLEVYLPPYLTSGAPRPVFAGISTAAWGYGQPVTMRTSVPSGNLNALRAVVLTNGAVTHATHMSQRHVTMVTQGVTGPDAEGFVNLTVTACPRAEVCPPGWYLLYVLDGETPSMGQWVQIGGDAGLGPGNFPGF